MSVACWSRAPCSRPAGATLTACVLLVFEVLVTRYDVKPVALGIVVFGGYSAVVYSRSRGAALVTVPWLWVVVGAVLWGTTALLILVSLALTVTVGSPCTPPQNATGCSASTRLPPAAR